MPHQIHRVALVDAVPLTRLGLRSLIESDPTLAVAFECATPREALEQMVPHAPDLILSEAVFPEGEGIFEFLYDLHARIGKVPLLVISRRDEQILATRVLHAGAQGYLMKSSPTHEILTAIHRVLEGKIHLSRAMTDRAVDHYATSPGNRLPTGLEDLTNRELEVLDLVGEGLPSKQIADSLSISLKTVESHRANIRAKLGISHSAGLIRYASQWRAYEGQRT